MTAVAGALFNSGGTVTIDYVAFTDNPGGPTLGGAVSNNGTLNLNEVSFTNDQGAIGGALFSRAAP